MLFFQGEGVGRRVLGDYPLSWKYESGNQGARGKFLPLGPPWGEKGEVKVGIERDNRPLA